MKNDKCWKCQHDRREHSSVCNKHNQFLINSFRFSFKLTLNRDLTLSLRRLQCRSTSSTKKRLKATK